MLFARFYAEIGDARNDYGVSFASRSSVCYLLTFTMAARRLRTLLASPGIMQMPCCFDALSAKLVQKAGYPITFASGFSISAAHGLPDTGLMSFGEMEATMQQITSGLSIP